MPVRRMGLGLLLFLSAAGIVQGQGFNITGRVVYSQTGLPAEGIRIELQKFSGEEIKMQFTRATGDFEFLRLARGSYYLSVEALGFEPVRQGVEIAGFNITGIVLYLTRQGERFSGPAGAVSVKQLKLSRKARDAFNRARELRYEKHDLRGSLPLFEEAIAEEPDYYEAYYELGLVYMQLELPHAAEDALRKAIAASDQTFTKAFAALAAVLNDQDKFAEAEPIARKSTVLEPRPWRGHYELSRALLGVDRVAEAEESWKAAAERRNDFPDLYLLAANIHMRKNDLPALLKAFEKYLDLAPNGPESAAVRERKAGVEKQLAQAKAVKQDPKP